MDQNAPEITDLVDGFWTCPVCMKQRTAEQFTPGHIVPQALGGRKWVPECWTCNTGFSPCDQDVKKFVRMQRFLQSGTGSIFATVSISPEASANCVISMDDGNVSIFVRKDKSEPTKSRALLTGLEQLALRKETDWELHFSALGGQGSKVRVGFYHSAFLALCDRFGHRYELDPCSEYIRTRLRMRPFERAASGLPDVLQRKLAPFRVDPVIAYLPELRGFVVSFGPVTVFLPGPGAPVSRGVARWNRAVRENQPSEFDAVIVGDRMESRDDDDDGLVIVEATTGTEFPLW